MFVNTRRKYTWKEIRDCYERGSAAIDCQRQFGISNGAWYAAVQRGAIALRRGVDTRPPGKTREAVGRMLGQGMSQAAIARALGISNPTVCFHVRKLGIEPRSALATRYDWERVRAYYDAGNSAAECRRQFGFSLSAWADAIRRGAIVARPRLEPLDSILAVGRERCRGHVKARLMMAGLKQARCEGCGLTDWCGRSLSFELHHVNGDGKDNRLENLRVLCPNCHSQTDTWGGRNRRRAS